MRRPQSSFLIRLLVAALCAVVTTEGMGIGPNGDCPLLTLLPFSNGNNNQRPPPNDDKNANSEEEPLQRWPDTLLHHYSYSYMAAAQLAMDHFNARDPVVVPQLAQLGDCGVTFPYQIVVDSALQDTRSIMGILSAHHTMLSEQFMKPHKSRRQRQLLPDGLPDHVVQQCPSLAEFSFNNLLPPWCAVLGPSGDKPVTQVSALTGALDIPQIIYGPVGHMALKDDVPTTVGVSLPSIGRAKATVGYLQRPGLERNYLAILHVPKPEILDIVQAIKVLSGKDSGLRTVSRESQGGKPGMMDPKKEYQKGVEWLKRTGMKTILLAFDEPHEIAGYADVLEEKEMLGNDFVYLLLEEGVSLDRIGDIFGELEPGSPIDKLLSGAAIISQTDKFTGIMREDPFLRAWKMQNASFVDYLNEMTPKDESTGEPLFQAGHTFFQEELPAAMASFMYDSVIAVGLGACAHQQMAGGQETILPQQPTNGDGPFPGLSQQPPTQEGGPPLPEEQLPQQGQPPGGAQAGDQPPQDGGPPLPEQQSQSESQIPGQQLPQQGQPPEGPHAGDQQQTPQEGRPPLPEQQPPEESGGPPLPEQQPPQQGQQPGGPQVGDQQQPQQLLAEQQQSQEEPPTWEQPPQQEQGQGSPQLGQYQGQQQGQPPHQGEQPQQQQGPPTQQGQVLEQGLGQQQRPPGEGKPPQQGALPPGQGTGRLLESEVLSWGNAELGLLPTVDRLFAKIQSALESMQRHDNSTAFVSRVQVTYNGTLGYPQRILIVYDIPRSNSSDSSPRPYNEFTYFATVTGVEPLDKGLKVGEATPAPSIEHSTIITTHSELQRSQEVFIQARSLWDSHHMMDYQFEYFLFFDTGSTGPNRQETPYPWDVVVNDLKVKTVTDAADAVLFTTDTPVSSAFNYSTNASSIDENAGSILTGEGNTTLTEAESLDLNATNLTIAANTTIQPAEQLQDIQGEDGATNSTNPPNTTTQPEQLHDIQGEDSATNTTHPPLQPPTPQSETTQQEHNGTILSNTNHTTAPPPHVPGAVNSNPTNFGQSPGGAESQKGKGQRGAKFVDSILKATFDGASGPVSFHYDQGKSRDIAGVPVGAFNIRPSAVNETTGRRRHAASLTSYSVLTNETKRDLWNSVPNQDFIYRDGSTVPPTTLREIEDQNFLSEWVHIIGLTLFAIALFLAVFSAISVWYLQNDRIMRAGQPPFLYLLCLGAAFMSGAIFTLSFDESFGWSNKQLDIACALTPWFFFVGHLLMFSALFTKMWRVDQVMQFKRGQTVRVIQVMGPLACLLVAASVILSVWTAIDPWVWERTVIQESPAETYGECTSEHFGLWFLLLTALIVLGKVTTAVMAWKTADIPQDFSDTSSVFYAISTHLQAWFIGIPILVVLGNDSVDATYFGRVLLIWIFSVSGVSLVIVPKIIRALQVRRNPALEKKSNVVVSGVASESTPTRSRFRGSYSKNNVDDSTRRPPDNMDESSQNHQHLLEESRRS